jgi:hypothetical protein
VLHEERATKNEHNQQPERAYAHAREAALLDPGFHPDTPLPSALPASTINTSQPIVDYSPWE